MELSKTNTATLISLLEKAAITIESLSIKEKDRNVARTCRVMRNKLLRNKASQRDRDAITSVFHGNLACTVRENSASNTGRLAVAEATQVQILPAPQLFEY